MHLAGFAPKGARALAVEESRYCAEPRYLRRTQVLCRKALPAENDLPGTVPKGAACAVKSRYFAERRCLKAVVCREVPPHCRTEARWWWWVMGGGWWVVGGGWVVGAGWLWMMVGGGGWWWVVVGGGG